MYWSGMKNLHFLNNYHFMMNLIKVKCIHLLHERYIFCQDKIRVG